MLSNLLSYLSLSGALNLWFCISCLESGCVRAFGVSMVLFQVRVVLLSAHQDSIIQLWLLSIQDGYEHGLMQLFVVLCHCNIHPAALFIGLAAWRDYCKPVIKRMFCSECFVMSVFVFCQDLVNGLNTCLAATHAISINITNQNTSFVELLAPKADQVLSLMQFLLHALRSLIWNPSTWAPSLSQDWCCQASLTATVSGGRFYVFFSPGW